jgi:hypothetical protein
VGSKSVDEGFESRESSGVCERQKNLERKEVEHAVASAGKCVISPWTESLSGKSRCWGVMGIIAI